LKSNLRSTWRLLEPHARPRVPQLVLVGVLGAIAAAAQVAALPLIYPLFELVLFPGQKVEVGGVAIETSDAVTKIFAGVRDHFAQGDEGRGRLAVLVAIVVALLLLGVVGGAAEYAFSWLSRLTGYQLIIDLRQRIARHLMSLSMRYHGRRQLGDLMSRIGSDVQATLQAINVALKELIQEPVSVLFSLGLAFYAAPWVTLVVLLLLPLLAVPLGRLATKVRKRSHRSLDSLGQSVQALTQIFQGMRAVKAFRAEERELARYRALNDGYLKDSMRMVRAISMTHAWTTGLGLIGLALLVLLIGWLTLRYDLFKNSAEMTAFVLAITQCTNHLKSFTKALTRVQEAVGASERLSQLLDEKPDVVERANPVAVRDLGSGLRFDAVTFTYPESTEPALVDVTLDIRLGETLAIVGPSGSGKSTLLDLVCRFVDPSSGAVRIGALDLRDAALDDWMKLWARVDQTPFLFHTTIGENIRYGKPGATQAEVEDAARAAGIHEFIQGLPQRYDTDVADMGTRLSGGQRQRITIARAFLKRAPLLLLDEATSSLDSESERVVQEALERLMEQRTVLVIAHRLSTIRRADRIAVVEGGRVVELGTHDELLRRGGTYARLHTLQQLTGASV
jgi:ABC-type multidrug transport system fused ATPase/permease subunit